MHRSHNIITASAICCFVAGVAISAARIQRNHQVPGPFDPSRQGYCDFHNGVYFPALAFRNGDSPYSLIYPDEYPVERPIPFYSPIILALHLPLTFLPLEVAEVVYFLLSVTLLWLLAFASVRFAFPNCREDKVFPWHLVWIFACGLLFSRGGQQTIFTGYFTLELILATLIAVQFGRSKPFLSMLGLTVISAKPTFVLPIAGLMLFRRNYKSVAIAAFVSALIAAAGFGWLSQSTSISEILQDIGTSQEIHRNDAYELPANTWTRLDVLAIVAKWTLWTPNDVMHLIAMIGLLLPSACVLARYHRNIDDDGGAAGLSGTIVLLASLLAIYHQVYDAMLLTPTISGLVIAKARPWNELSTATRYGLLACLLLPGINYASSLMFLNAFNVGGTAKQIVTSLNTIALTIACVGFLCIAWQQSNSKIEDC